MVPKIIFEDQHILVAYKPEGMAVETAKITETDLLSYLKNYLKKPYLAMVHRLDQPVEGLLVFAKTPFAAKELSRQVQDKRMKKRYLAAVSIDREVNREQACNGEEIGIKEDCRRLLEDYLLKDGKANTSKVVTKETKGAKKAALFYELTAVHEKAGIGIAEIELITGRHHQIRVQLAHAGIPLLGDLKYGNEASIRKSKQLQVRQTALCAYQLEFFHPKTGKPLSYRIEPEKEAIRKYEK